MTLQGECKSLKIIVNENSKYHGHSLYHAIVLKLRELGLAGATVARGIEGYGQEKHLHSSKMTDVSFELPVIIEVIDQVETINLVIPILLEMVKEGLVLTSDVFVHHYGKSK